MGNTSAKRNKFFEVGIGKKQKKYLKVDQGKSAFKKYKVFLPKRWHFTNIKHKKEERGRKETQERF